MARQTNTPNPLPEKQELESLFIYDPETGVLSWRHGGKEAGGIQGGYYRLTLNGVHYLAHRVIWKIVNGSDPIQIDHVDGNRTNNRIENLRDVSHQVNAKNRKLYENNKSGVHGVSFHNRDDVWQVRIGVGRGKELHLGNFKTWDEAISVRIAAQTILDYHDNHGRF